MGFIATDANKIILYYDSESSLGKQTHAYVMATEKEVLTIDISKTNVPGSHWAEMAEKLKLKIGDLIDREHPDFVQSYGNDKIDLDEDGWLKLLDKSPRVLAHPILFIGNSCYQVETPSQVAQYLESDRKGTSK